MSRLTNNLDRWPLLQAEFTERPDESRLVPALLVLTGAGIGFFGWGHGISQLATLLPVVWALARSRWQAYFVVVAYYLAGSRVIPSAADIFFFSDTSWLLGWSLWGASAAALALPWALLHTRNPAGIVPRLLIVLTLVSIPPLGLIGWLNPIISAGQLVPGHGWFSLAFGLVMMSVAAVTASVLRNGVCTRLASSVACASTICILAISIFMHSTVPDEPYQWHGATTHEGQEPDSADEVMTRYLSLRRITQAQLEAGNRVLVFPETFIGPWTRVSRHAIEAHVGAMLRESGATIVVGASLPVVGSERKSNGLVIFDGYSWDFARARHVVPVSMWRPWAADSYKVNWAGQGVAPINGKRALISLCFEDYLVWTKLMSFARHSPEVIVAPANFWWVQGSGADRIQREHVKGWARIFNIPLITSQNVS